MKLRTLGLSLVLAGAVSASARADVNVDFSFVAPYGDPGTVSGEILGLADSGSSTPTGVIIDSTPPDFGLSTPVTWSTTPTGTFTITDGVVTAADFYVNDPDGNYLDLDYQGTYNWLSYDSTNSFNLSGFAGATYTVVPVPEPSQYGWGLLLATLGFVAWRRFAGSPARTA